MRVWAPTEYWPTCAGRKVAHLARGRGRPAGSGPSFDRWRSARRKGWSAWSSGRRSGGCIGSRVCRSGRSAGGRGCIATRSGGRWRRASRRGMCAAPAGSKLDPFKDWICEQFAADPRIQSQRLREMAGELGYEGGKSIFDDYRPRGPPAVSGAADVPADGVSAGRAGPVRSVGAERADAGRSRAAPSRLGGDLRGRAGRVRSPARWCSPRRRRTSCGVWRATCCGWGRCRRSWCGIVSRRSLRAAGRLRRSPRSAVSWRSAG